MRLVLVCVFVVAAVAILSFPSSAQLKPPGAVPVPGLTLAQQAAFADGSRTFTKIYRVSDGLGPVFNQSSCNDCHRNGGGGDRTNTWFGRLDLRGAFDPLGERGGSLVQGRGIGSITTAAGTYEFVGERLPAEATIVAFRRSHGLLGLGFVDAVPAETLHAIAQEQMDEDPATAGRVQIVRDPVTGALVVGKFGWKAQMPSLRAFAGDALLHEMGITNPLFQDEVCPQGDCWALDFNPAPALNDDGRDVESIAAFMTMLAAPARGAVTEEVSAGERVFDEIGCAVCHRPTLGTGPSDIAALDRQDFHPYSDFLLHDMGSLGDGIAQNRATGREMRTQPLWGLRTAGRLLHNTSAGSIEEAVDRHDGQGRAARDRFTALPADRLAQILAFLRSL